MTANTKQQVPSTKRGFTLIEMSIVLAIIGLLAGGVVLGAVLIEQFKLGKFMKTVDQSISAINAFKLKYNCLPGDCGAASQLGLGTDGDNNGHVNFVSGVPGESERAMTQLVTARLLPEKQYNSLHANPAVNPTFGANQHYALPWMSQNNYSSPTLSMISGRYCPWGPACGGRAFYNNGVYFGNGGPLSEGVLSYEQMTAIDQKIDNGSMTSGKYYGWNRTSGSPVFCDASTQALGYPCALVYYYD